MNLKSKLSIALVALMLTMPLGTVFADSGWLSQGGGVYEPSTTFDTTNVMFDTPNNQALDKVYFNAYALQYAGYLLGTTYQPNLDGGSIFSPYSNLFTAVLGFWRDCNGDGYIGLKGAPAAYGSYTSYPAALSDALGKPIDTTVCAPGGDYWITNPTTGQPNGMIDEFRWLGPNAGCDYYEPGCPDSGTEGPSNICVPPSQQPIAICQPGPLYAQTQSINDVTDNSSRVWGDWERPGGVHVPYGPLTPLPRGTFSDSDGTLTFVDDATLRALSSTVPGWDTKPNIGHCDQPNPVFLGGSSSTCGLWPLWQVRRVVNDTTCNNEQSEHGQQYPGCSEPDPLVTTWDTQSDGDGDGNPCNDAFDFTVNNPQSNQPLARIALPDPALGPDSLNPNFLADGSISGTLEHQRRALNSTGTGQSSQDAECADHAAGVGDPVFEIDTPDTQARHIQPSMILNYTSGNARFHSLAPYGFYDVDAAELANGGGGPSGAGLATAGWFSNLVWTARPPRAGWGYVTETYTTFYADVSTQSVSVEAAKSAVPSGAQDSHTYGVEYCDAFTTGPSNVDPDTKWECSTDEWEKAREEYGTGDRRHWGAIIGDKYDLRDVDCYDNSVSRYNWVTEGALDGLRAGVASCDHVNA